MVVVLPAPSAPISPNISPLPIVSDSSRTAATAPYDLLTRSSVAAAVSAAKDDLRFDGHAAFQDAFAVIDGNLDSVDQLRPVVCGLDISRRELGFIGDLTDRPRDPVAACVG